MTGRLIFLFLLSFLNLSIIIACSPASLPKQIYLKNNELKNFDNVALNLSSNKLSLSYSKEDFSPAVAISAVIPIAIFYHIFLEDQVDDFLDQERLKNVEVSQKSFEIILANHFISVLKKAKIFKIDYSDIKHNSELISYGYDAKIDLIIAKLELRKQPYSEKLKVDVRVEGKMTDLSKEKVIWERTENLLSDEEYTLNELKDKSNMIEIDIDKLLKKISIRLANDFIYS